MIRTLLPGKVRAFFVAWFKPLPEIPKSFTPEFIAACRLHFRYYPTFMAAKSFEKNHWFWWSGLVVTMIFGWFTDNYILALLNVFCLLVGSVSMLLMVWCMMRHIRFVNWLIKLQDHSHYKYAFVYVLHHSMEYDKLTIDKRNAYDGMKAFVDECQECENGAFKR